MTLWISLLVIAAVVVALIAVFGAKEEKLYDTEEEFEEEAQRASLMRAGMVELHKVFQPHRAKQIVEEQIRVKQEKNFSGDKPHDPPPLDPPDED
jgi:hypothetical protein